VDTQHRIRAALVALAVAWVAASPARGLTLHLVAEPAHPAPGESVRVRLVAGAPFAGAAAAPAGDVAVERLWNAGRVRLLASADDGITTFVAEEPGVQLLAFSDAEGTVASFAKTLVVVSGAARGERIWCSVLGQRLEIVPETAPAALAEGGGRFEARVLLDHGPLAGAAVVAVLERGDAAGGFRQALTDARGRVALDLDRPGRWLVHLAYKATDLHEPSQRVVLEASLVVVAGTP
jgi:hypothetical protein